MKGGQYTHVTHDNLRRAHAFTVTCGALYSRAAAAAPNPLVREALKMAQGFNCAFPRQHSLDEFSWDAAGGAGGCEFRESVLAYEYAHHTTFKSSQYCKFDYFLLGRTVLGLLLHWGNISAARRS